MMRPGYREAIEWIACNDDCYWLGDEGASLSVTASVTASMVRDLFGVTDEKLIADLRRKLKQVYPDHEVFK